jgi:hypothetical protein
MHRLRPARSREAIDPSRSVVFLTDSSLLDVSTEEAHALVTHEVVHVLSPPETSHNEVAALAASWGFERRAAQPEKYDEWLHRTREPSPAVSPEVAAGAMGLLEPIALD